MFETLLNYLKQPSTYTGIFTVLGVFGVMVSTDLTQAIIATATAIVGLVDVIRKEHTKEK